MTTVLRLRERDQVDIERSRLESLFADRVAEYHEDLLPLTDNLSSIKNLPVNDWMEGPDGYYGHWVDAGTCFGEECDDVSKQSQSGHFYY